MQFCTSRSSASFSFSSCAAVFSLFQTSGGKLTPCLVGITRPLDDLKNRLMLMHVYPEDTDIYRLPPKCITRHSPSFFETNFNAFSASSSCVTRLLKRDGVKTIPIF